MNVTLDDAGADAFAGQLYLCQLATALKLKSVVERHRAGNIFGLLTWQLGEQWSTYGAGVLVVAAAVVACPWAGVSRGVATPTSLPDACARP